MVSATSLGQRRPAHVRAPKASYDPLHERAKLFADRLWERAMDIANTLAPEVPHDQEPLDPFDQWQLLESVAISLNPATWDRPDAINDLYNLRMQFLPQADNAWLKVLAQRRAAQHGRFRQHRAGVQVGPGERHDRQRQPRAVHR